jgi:hypothetical protein
MRKLAIIVATTLVGTGIASAPAFAQAVPQAPPEMDPGEAVLPNDPILEGAGVKVGEGTVIHPLVGLETGVVSNVFYEDQNPTAAGVLRLLVEIGTGSLPAERTTVGSTDDKNGTAETAANVSKGDFAYNANLYLTYDQYLSGDSDVTNQGGLGIGFLARGTVNPQRTFRFGFLEDFNRVIRSVDFETQSDNANRDLNQLVLQLQYFPEGRNLSGYLYFEDKFDLFEDENQRFADRTQNALGVRLNYQWLPQTRTFLNVSEGVYTGLGSDSRKVTSYPLLALLGIETALTLRTTVQARLGYTHGFYEAGPDFSALTGGIQFAYRYNPLGRVTLLYHYTHEDSINANFYGEHFIQAGIEHYFVPFLVFANGEIHLRDYQGLLIPGNMNSRDDFIAAANAGLRYGFRHNIAATVDYHFAAVQTDFRYMAAGIAPEDPSYVRHELLAGVRATY